MNFKLILIVTLLLVFQGCKYKKKSVAIQRSNSVTVAWAKGASTLDPACAVGMESAEVISQIYEGLVFVDPDDGKVKLRLAESYQTNGLVWDFTLRRGIKFHDGSELDASDVVASFQRQINSLRGATSSNECGYDYWKAYFTMVKSIKTLDKYRVRIVLNYPYAPFLKALEIFAVTILPSEAIKKGHTYINKHPVGTGPFKFSSKTKNRIVLETNKNYWLKKNKPDYQYLIFQTIRDNQQRLLALEGDRIDFAYHLDPMRSLTIKLHPTLDIKKIDSSNVVYMAMNTKRSPLSIKLNRLAVNYAINREKIVKLVYQGNATLAQGAIFPSMLLDGKKLVPDDRWYGYNPQKAKELLEESGYYKKYADKVLKLYVMYNPRPYLPNPVLMANLIKKDLAKIGIKIRIYAQEYRTYKKSTKEGKHDLAIHGWIGDIWDPDTFLYGLLSGSIVVNKTGTNYAFFMNSEYDQLVKEARSENKTDKRIKLYRKAMLIFKKEAPWVPFAHAKLIVPYARRIRNLKYNISTLGLYNLMKIEK